MTHSKISIATEVKLALQNPATLYDQNFAKRTGTVGSEPYSEIVAQELLKNENLALLNAISQITRSASYKTKSHEALAKRKKPEHSNRDEEWIAKGLYGRTLDRLGKIIDFQTPLKDNAGVKKVGKIDLLSHCEDMHTAYFLELKKPLSKEPLLRCVLEIYTYWKTANQKKLLSDFEIPDAELRKGIILFENCTAYLDFRDKRYAATHRLMRKLGVDIFVLDEEKYDMIEACLHEQIVRL